MSLTAMLASQKFYELKVQRMKALTAPVRIAALVYLLLFVVSCSDGGRQSATDDSALIRDSLPGAALFTLLSPSYTGVRFRNELVEDAAINYISCTNCYNGGGVAVGDINGDDLPDLYFSANQQANRLYLNQGDMHFKDITKSAGVDGSNGWSTGVTMADVNGDGLLDIYVCRALQYAPEPERANLLYINNGDLTFSERAAEFGLDDRGFSTHATFFDFDRDNDLDVYIVNRPNGKLMETYDWDLRMEAAQDPFIRDQLYRNEGNGRFTNISEEAGIYNCAYGLSATAGDLNNDGFIDLFVANDFIEHDFVYINNGDGSFTDRVHDMMKHISNFSMGADVADINNDGFLDIFVLDMVAEDHYRNKVMMGAMDSKTFYSSIGQGYHHQYMANMLHLNNGDGSFAEISQLAGVGKTDWSWAALLADFDNDGYRDLFVSNGILRDSRHNDYFRSAKNKYNSMGGGSMRNHFDLVQNTPQTRLRNYIYRNNGDLTFSNKQDDWGMNPPSFSSGAAYADLDGDGDLDLVVNNLNDTAFVYRNNSVAGDRNFLRFALQGPEGNRLGLGARVTIYKDQAQQTGELTLSRGFLSSSEPVIHFGLGNMASVDRAEVVWPDGRRQTLKDLAANQTVVVKAQEAAASEEASQAGSTEKAAPLVSELPDKLGIDFVHEERPYDDFATEILLPNRFSQNGPGLAVGDVNGDGRDDVFFCAAAGSAAQLYLQNADGRFRRTAQGPWEGDAAQEDMAAVFFDSDMDGDLDLYVVSGSNEFEAGSAMLQDRLYRNDGQGSFSKTRDALPELVSSGSCVVAGDYDRDGDLDLFVGGRVLPNKYPFPAPSYILRNDGGKFSDATAEVAPELREPGLVTSALWTDFDNDGALDLIVVGEWMPVSIFQNRGNRLKRFSGGDALALNTGWWHSIVGGDFDRDGDIDYVVGNLGKNSKYKASAEKPLHVYCHDFDKNGVLDIVLAYHNSGECYPVRGRECTSEQMPLIARKFKTYHEFASANVTELYGEKALNDALSYESRYFKSAYLENKGGQKFVFHALPTIAQTAPVFGMLAHDIDYDGNLDIIMVGNYYAPEVETIRYDAFTGLILRGDGRGGFSPMPSRNSGFSVPGDAKGLALLSDAASGQDIIIAAINNGAPQVFRSALTQPAHRNLRIGPLEVAADVVFKDGRTVRCEFPYGSGYLSGSARFLRLTEDVDRATIYSSRAAPRKVNFEQLALN